MKCNGLKTQPAEPGYDHIEKLFLEFLTEKTVLHDCPPWTIGFFYLRQGKGNGFLRQIEQFAAEVGYPIRPVEILLPVVEAEPNLFPCCPKKQLAVEQDQGRDERCFRAIGLEAEIPKGLRFKTDEPGKKEPDEELAFFYPWKSTFALYPMR